MNRVDLIEAQLEGFGRFRQRTTFSLAPGLNVLLAPNESGKSTLLAGLQALLFGLPEKSDPDAWGTSRFRNWSGGAHFRGQLLLRSDHHWHRIGRDFASHAVRWVLAPCGAAEEPPGDDSALWRPCFEGEHNPGARGGSNVKMEGLLRELLGIDDVQLFRLTYCVTQDPEDRSDEEIIFRRRRIPDSLQGLISGSGSTVDDLLGRLFDEFAAITQATGDAGLVRPGRSKPANQRTPGSLEQVRDRRQEAGRDLAAAQAILEELRGSQEQLLTLREGLDRQRESVSENRRLLDAMDKWLRVRKDQRRLDARAAELDHALEDLQQRDAHLQKDSDALKASFPEYRNPSFAFEKKRAELEELVAAEKDRVARRKKLDEIRERRLALEEVITSAETEIAGRFAAFAECPHLLRDFDEWQKVGAQLARHREELQAIDDAAARHGDTVKRLEHWAALDLDATEPGLIGHPAAKLHQLREEVPRLISRAREAQRLDEELRQLNESLEGPLKPMAAADPEVRREAQAFADRHALHRMEAEKTARQLAEVQERQAELEAKEIVRLELEEKLTHVLGAPAEHAGALPENWRAAAEELHRKLQGLQEESDLLRRIDDAEQAIRMGLFRQVMLPSLVVFLLVAAAGMMAGLAFLPSLILRAAFGAGTGLAAGAISGIISYRRSKGSTLHELALARGRLSAVRRTLLEGDRTLGALAKLQAEELTELLRDLNGYAQHAADLASLQVLCPSPEERAEARQAADQAEGELAEFERRMAAIGEDPAELHRRWSDADRRAAGINERLEALLPEVGPVDWASRPADDLPDPWIQPLRLAVTVAGLQEGGGTRPTTGAAVAAVLDAIEPKMWEQWAAEAAELEDASREMAHLAVRRKALEEVGEQAVPRLEQLTKREAELAKTCAPLDRDTPREELEALRASYDTTRAQCEKSRALLEELRGEVPALEDALREAEQRVNGLRDVLRGLLSPAAGDPGAALRRLQEAGKLQAQVTVSRSGVAGILQSLDLDSLPALRTKLESVRGEAAQALGQVSELEERFPLLHELADQDADEIQRLQSDLQRRITESEGRLAKLEDQRESTRHQAAGAEAEGRRLGNAAALEIEIGELATAEERLLRERDALRLAFETLREAAAQFGHSHRERLAERASELIGDLCLNHTRSIELGESYDIRITEGDGHACSMRQLSQGARDQLALSLRLAVAELLSAGAQPPLFLDDPFLSFDPERLAATRQTLDALAAVRQVVILSHREDLAAWGRKVRVTP